MQTDSDGIELTVSDADADRLKEIYAMPHLTTTREAVEKAIKANFPTAQVEWKSDE